MKACRVAGGLYLKTVIRYTLLTEPIKIPIKSNRKGNKAKKSNLRSSSFSKHKPLVSQLFSDIYFSESKGNTCTVFVCLNENSI